MDISERHAEMISRLFGPGAVLAGTVGTVDRPGQLEIRVNGVTAGRGPTLAVAIAAASAALSVVARFQSVA